MRGKHAARQTALFKMYCNSRLTTKLLIAPLVLNLVSVQAPALQELNRPLQGFARTRSAFLPPESQCKQFSDSTPVLSTCYRPHNK